MKKRNIVLIVLVFIVMFIVTLFYSVPEFEIYGQRVSGNGISWMKDIEDDLLLSDIFIPGTHDSGTHFSRLPYFTKCQWNSIYSQLEEGYRYLDIRVGQKDDELILTHADMPCLETGSVFSKPLTMEETIESCIQFLNENPSETIVFVVKRDANNIDIKTLQLKLDELIQKNEKNWLLTDEMPTLEESRGKIVLFRRYSDEANLNKRSGIDIYWDDQDRADTKNGYIIENEEMTVQDFYSLSVENKWTAFETALHTMPAHQLNINFLSTKGTGVYGHPFSQAKKLNQKYLNTTLENVNPQWIVMDFGTENLARHVFEMNMEDTIPAIPVENYEGWHFSKTVLSYLSDEFAFICISVLLLTVLLRYNILGGKVVQPIVFTVVIAIILSAVDYLEAIFASDMDPNIWRVILSVTGYILRPAAAFGLMGMTGTDKKLFTISKYLLAINTIIYCTAPFNHLSFWFDDRNGFHRGPLGYSSHVVSLIFICFLVILAYRYAKSKQRHDTLLIILSATICAIVAIFQTTGWLNDKLNITIVIACVFYYLYLHLQMTSMDIGTGILNRQAFYSDYLREENRISALIGLDMNGLKEINDKYGHDAGDKGLSKLADVLMACVSDSGCAYRVGGDEFIIQCFDMSELEVRQLMNVIQYTYGKTGYSCSVGYAMKEKGMTIEELIKQTDTMMYEDKRKYYQNKEAVAK